MPKISTYKTVIPEGDDKIIISQQDGTPSNVTKNITVDGLKNYVNSEKIPTPYVYVLKRPYVDATTKNNKAFVAMQKPIETDWLTKNPRLFMFRYRKQKTRIVDLGPTNEYIMKRANFVHPSHNNGEYQRANFPGSNWASTPQTTDVGEVLFPIPTEWDINSELKIAKTGSLITDFASLRPTTYIEVPFNPLGFLFESLNPTEVTSLPATTTQDFWGTRFSVTRPSNNVNYDNNPNDYRTSQIIMKFAIGIPNPTWTNTNHELPYIFGDLSNAVTLKYQYDGNDSQVVNNYTITQGSTGNAQRSSN